MRCAGQQIIDDCEDKMDRDALREVRYQRIYAKEHKDYIERKPWSDVADNRPFEVPVLMGLIAACDGSVAQDYLSAMLYKSADLFADSVANREIQAGES